MYNINNIDVDDIFNDLPDELHELVKMGIFTKEEIVERALQVPTYSSDS